MDWNSLSYNTIYWSLYCKGRREAPTLDGYMRLILYGSVQDFGIESHQNMPYFGGFVLIILDITSINLSNMVDGLEFVVL